MNNRKIYLLRHGQIVTDSIKRYIGQIDLPLSEIGRRQAVTLRDEISNIEFDSIFCSDLDRSIVTAKIICEKQSVKPQARRDLREIDMGSWEGVAFDEVRRKYPDQFEKRGEDIFNYQTPGGESFAQCAGRVLAAVAEMLERTTGNILIIGHAGVNRIIICHILNIPWESLFKIKQDYGCLNVLLPEAVGPKVIVLNSKVLSKDIGGVGNMGKSRQIMPLPCPLRVSCSR